MRTLVLGLGNPILGDDAIGLVVAEGLRERLADDPTVEIDVDFCGGLRLMERIVGYDDVVIIDAICSGEQLPGSVVLLEPGDLPTLHSSSSHDVSLPTALRLASDMGLQPPQVHIVAIAIKAASTLDFREELSPAVADAVPAAVQAVLSLLAQKDASAPARMPDRAQSTAAGRFSNGEDI